ncbi:MAG TPA: PilN domain-containing protein [Nitrospiria bacterium]|jgi:Tfp pilus assembly protein PilN|nr:PilN domain-containing protein [Nitrospiria bacterium]
MKSHINLIAAEILLGEKPFSFKQKAGPMGVAAGVFFLGVFSLGLLWKESLLKKDVRDLTVQRDKTQLELTRLNEEVGGLAKETQAGQEITAQQLAAMKDLLKNRILWSNVLRETSYLVPEGVWLTRMESTDPKSGGLMPVSATENGLRFVGVAQSQAAINRFISALERSPHYGYVALVYAEKGSAGAQGMNFELTANLH